MSQSKVGPAEAPGLSALIPRRRDGGGLGLPIGLLFREDPVGGFGQMAGDGPDRLLMALALSDAFVEASDVAARRAAAIETDCVRGFDEGPLEIAVDVWAGRPEAGFPTARVDARGRARIGGELLGGGEACDIADLERDHHGEREAHAGQGEEVLNRRRRLEQDPDLLLELTHLVVEPLDLLEQMTGGVGRTGWQELETLAQEGAAACAEEVAHSRSWRAYLAQVE